MQRILIKAIAVLFIIVIAASCQYKFIVEPEPTPPEPGDTTSFSLDVLPIFNNNNNCTGCHNTGGTPPDLTPDNAYDQIISLNLADTANPDQSGIYTIPHPDGPEHTWKKYTNNEAATVLRWIEEGAKNN
jgi:hypothetical protein